MVSYVGGCQNYGPFLGTLNIRCRIILGIQKGTIILTTTYVKSSYQDLKAVTLDDADGVIVRILTSEVPIQNLGLEDARFSWVSSLPHSILPL